MSKQKSPGKVVGAVGNPCGVGLLRAFDFIDTLSDADLVTLCRAYVMISSVLREDPSIIKLFTGVMEHKEAPGEFLKAVAPSGAMERILAIKARVDELKPIPEGGARPVLPFVGPNTRVWHTMPVSKAEAGRLVMGLTSGESPYTGEPIKKVEVFWHVNGVAAAEIDGQTVLFVSPIDGPKGGV